MAIKRLKDPIYGYIELEDVVCADYIDTAEFQRLRRIVQTSYGPLYPSALHNRFVHSLGVYYLGKHAVSVLGECVKVMFENEEDLLVYWEEIAKSFRTACLLHDFGHSPFSHSGEIFYSSHTGDSLDEELIKVVDDVDFTSDVRGYVTGGQGAAEHEVMSAILALEKFENIPNRSLFARCITGYKHADEIHIKDHLDNILIELLNSKTIDVDRLDYLIRDSFVVGFDSITIDHKRLLDGLRIVKTNSGGLCLCYHKSAISVLENVVYARDLERKWIQSHPAILYDQFLVQHAIKTVNKNFKTSDGVFLFSKDSLTSQGLISESGLRVRYLSDDDVIFLAKNENNDDLIEEYFYRGLRRRPIWKSESEYRSLFRLDVGNLAAIDELEKMFAELIKSLDDNDRDLVLNDDTLDYLQREREEACQDNEEAPTRQLKYRMIVLDRQIHFLKALRELITGRNLKFNFVLIGVSSFKSGFGASSLDGVRVVYSEGRYFRFDDVSGHFEAKNEINGLYYLYHESASKDGFPKAELIDFLKKFYSS